MQIHVYIAPVCQFALTKIVPFFFFFFKQNKNISGAYELLRPLLKTRISSLHDLKKINDIFFFTSDVF